MAILSDIASVVAVLGIIGILLLVGNFYRRIRAKAWLWLIVAWLYALGVRFYVMILDLWPKTFHEWVPANSVLNGLMAFVYVALFIGFLTIYIEMRRIDKQRNSDNNARPEGP